MLRAKNVVFPPNQPNQKVSQEVKDIIKKCLEYSHEERYNVIEAYNAIHGIIK
jgi:serine/threonine protein kinase